MSGEGWWYLARASGIVAWLILTLTVLWGIASSADLFGRRRRVAWLVDLHRWLGALTVAFVALHLGALVADSYVHFGPTDLFVPFASDWKPLPVALGVVALWGLMAVQATSVAMRRLRRRTWHAIHLAGYGVFVLGSFHGITAGTDATQPMYAITTAASMLAVGWASIRRIRVLDDRRRRSASSDAVIAAARPGGPVVEPATRPGPRIRAPSRSPGR
jgi:methionine sulfoxide reductase heme-binding subunit